MRRKNNSSLFLFDAVDINGIPFQVEWDGAERIGFWVGDPENSTPLSIEVSEDLIEWILENWRMKEEVVDIESAQN